MHNYRYSRDYIKTYNSFSNHMYKGWNVGGSTYRNNFPARMTTDLLKADNNIYFKIKNRSNNIRIYTTIYNSESGLSSTRFKLYNSIWELYGGFIIPKGFNYVLSVRWDEIVDGVYKERTDNIPQNIWHDVEFFDDDPVDLMWAKCESSIYNSVDKTASVLGAKLTYSSASSLKTILIPLFYNESDIPIKILDGYKIRWWKIGLGDPQDIEDPNTIGIQVIDLCDDYIDTRTLYLDKDSYYVIEITTIDGTEDITDVHILSQTYLPTTNTTLNTIDRFYNSFKPGWWNVGQGSFKPNDDTHNRYTSGVLYADTNKYYRIKPGSNTEIYITLAKNESMTDGNYDSSCWDNYGVIAPKGFYYVISIRKPDDASTIIEDDIYDIIEIKDDVNNIMYAKLAAGSNKGFIVSSGTYLPSTNVTKNTIFIPLFYNEYERRIAFNNYINYKIYISKIDISDYSTITPWYRFYTQEEIMTLDADSYYCIAINNSENYINPDNVDKSLIYEYPNIRISNDEFINHEYYKFYKSFWYGSVSTDDTLGVISKSKETSSAIRQSNIINLSKPTILRMMNTNYVFRLYYYNTNSESANVLCSTAWQYQHVIPPNKDVAITIKHAVSDSNFNMNEYPAKYLYPLEVNDSPKDYYKEEIANFIDRVKEANDEPGLVFLLTTDQHYNTVQGTLASANSIVKYDTITDMCCNMKAVLKHINVDGIISLGDIADFKWLLNTDGNGNDTSNKVHNLNLGLQYIDIDDVNTTTADAIDEVFYDWQKTAISQLFNIGPELIYVMGNHDDNRYINRNRLLLTGYDRYCYSTKDLYKKYLSYNKLNRVSNYNMNGNDYYIDFDNHKIRMFCLQSSLYDKNTNKWWYGITQETIDWVSDQLNTLPEDYGVIFVQHQSCIYTNNIDYTLYNGFNELKTVINNFISIEGNENKYIGTLYGHSHFEWSNTEPWLEISFAAGKVQNVSINAETSEKFPNAVGPSRTINTATEDCWYAVIIQPGSGVVKTIGFGAANATETNKTRVFTYKKEINDTSEEG